MHDLKGSSKEDGVVIQLSKLILPAGNVFEFKSLNTDSEGHVYTLITYKDTDKLSQI